MEQATSIEARMEIEMPIRPLFGGMRAVHRQK